MYQQYILSGAPMALGQQVCTTAAQPPSPPTTALESVGQCVAHANARMAEIVSHAEALGNRLCGEEPQAPPVNAVADRPPIGGVTGAVHQAAIDLHGTIDRLTRALGRLDQL